ncbi:MAG: hypothetical protein AABX75_01415 [Nanoarchaeota archaeon]
MAQYSSQSTGNYGSGKSYTTASRKGCVRRFACPCDGACGSACGR